MDVIFIYSNDETFADNGGKKEDGPKGCIKIGKGGTMKIGKENVMNIVPWEDVITDDFYKLLERYFPSFLIGGSYALWTFEIKYTQYLEEHFTHLPRKRRTDWHPNDIDIFIPADYFDADGEYFLKKKGGFFKGIFPVECFDIGEYKMKNEDVALLLIKRNIRRMIRRSGFLKIIKDFQTSYDLDRSLSYYHPDDEAFSRYIMGAITLRHKNIPLNIQLVFVRGRKSAVLDMVNGPAVFFFKRANDYSSWTQPSSETGYEFLGWAYSGICKTGTRISSQRQKKYEKRGYVFF